MTVSKIGRGQSQMGSHRNEMDYKSLNLRFMTTYCIFSETLGLAQSDYIWCWSVSGSRNFSLFCQNCEI